MNSRKARRTARVALPRAALLNLEKARLPTSPLVKAKSPGRRSRSGGPPAVGVGGLVRFEVAT